MDKQAAAAAAAEQLNKETLATLGFESDAEALSYFQSMEEEYMAYEYPNCVDPVGIEADEHEAFMVDWIRDQCMEADIEESLAQLEKNEKARKLRKERPWVHDIIRALMGGWLTKDQLDRTLWSMRDSSGLNMPKEFSRTVQSFLNRHTSQSSRWNGKPETDLFYSPKGKRSGTWAVHRDRAVAWLKARQLPEV
jgi:hypothetical protein